MSSNELSTVVPPLLNIFSIITSLPKPQLIGIVVGTVVFTFTISLVLYLLIKGGSLDRLKEEFSEGDGGANVKGKSIPATSVSNRPLLLETYLSARSTMLARQARSPFPTLYQKMSLSPKTSLPSTFQSLYKHAFRSFNITATTTVPGHPNAPIESYSRAFAGSATVSEESNVSDIPDFLLEYTRTYSRVYASVCCTSPSVVERYEEMYNKNPSSLVGNSVHLTSAEGSDLKTLALALDGSPFDGESAYETDEVWGFHSDLFATPESGDSPAQTYSPSEINEALRTITSTNSSAIAWDTTTLQPFALITLTSDCPFNLSIQLASIITNPSYEGTTHHLEATFLVVDRLFSQGYRRVEAQCDSKHVEYIKFLKNIG